MEHLAIPEAPKRSFYEAECLRGNWSVRELKRQIASRYVDGSGLSRDQAKLTEFANAGVEPASPRLAIRDPYIFEFLGLKPKDVMSESHLEDQLLDRLQESLLELGHGFCFEARQKRILIGDSHGFLDLAGMDNQLFVSKYQLHLPGREQLQRELERTLKGEG